MPKKYSISISREQLMREDHDDAGYDVSAGRLVFAKILTDAHKHSRNNREEIKQSDQCGCFYCGRTFSPSVIVRWVTKNEQTALCPFCDIDSVIGSAAGFQLTPEFLQAMHQRWFSPQHAKSAKDLREPK